METIFAIIIIWLLVCFLFAEFGALFFELLGYAIAFIFQCIFVALFFVLRGIAIGLLWTARKAARGIALCALFLSILVQEWWRGTADQGDPRAGREDGAPLSYDAALDLLGLRPGFTRKAFDRAYKAAMKRAHPDLGGSTAQAQRVNAARETILQAQSWA